MSQAELLSAIKKQHMAHLTNINDCQLVDENEIQFQIESKLAAEPVASLHRTRLGSMSSSSSSSNSYYNQTPYYYHIEILVPSSSASGSSSTSPPRFTLPPLSPTHKHLKTQFRALSQHPVWLKFKFKIEDSSQVR